jgi:lipopolysaccharide assembly protein A
MRYIYIALIVVATAAVLLFKIQNLEVVTVSFLTLSFSMPVSLLVLVIYVLGMFTGGALWSLLRSWLAKARAQP